MSVLWIGSHEIVRTSGEGECAVTLGGGSDKTKKDKHATLNQAER